MLLICSLFLFKGDFDFFKGSFFSLGSVDFYSIEFFMVSFGVFGSSFFGEIRVFSNFSENFGH